MAILGKYVTSKELTAISAVLDANPLLKPADKAAELAQYVLISDDTAAIAASNEAIANKIAEVLRRL